MGSQKVLHTWLRIKIVKRKFRSFIICWATQRPKYVLSRMPLGLVSVVGCGLTKPFKMRRATMMQGGPPSIRANIAVVNDETASASFRCGYFENDVSSLSARCIN